MNIQKSNFNQPAFNGFLTKTKKTFSPHTLNRMADAIHMSTIEIYRHTRIMTPEQHNFFEILTEKYKSKYHYAEQKENPQILFNIVSLVQNPTKNHYRVLANLSGSFENVAKVFKAITDKKDFEFVKNFEKKVFKNENHAENIIADILNSPNKEEYINHTGDYISYLRLNKENPNVIQELDKMISEGTYDRAVYDKQRDLTSYFKRFQSNRALPKEDIENYYSSYGIDFMKEFSHSYYVPANYSEEAKAELTEIYKTCNKENISMRKFILEKYQAATYHTDRFNEEIKAMRALFEKLDNDVYAEKFVDKFLQNEKNIESVEALNEILETVSGEKAYIFHKNLSRIVQITKPGAERKNILETELTNPNYENAVSKNMDRNRKNAVDYGFARPESRFDKLFKRFENEFNKVRYSFMQKGKSEVKPVETETGFMETTEVITPVKNEGLIKPEIVKPETEIAPASAQEKEAAEFVELPKFEQELTTPSGEASGIKLVNTILTKAQKRKIEAQESVRKFIHEKLHPSIVNEQEKIYINKATKMRLKMLPEILASIKDARAAQRAEGIKRPKISNFDAVDLYTRIDGKNKKLVNYMLKKRSADGTRMFNVNDIIEELGKSHKQVILDKLKPAQARELYEEAYQTKLNEFGELKPVKNK